MDADAKSLTAKRSIVNASKWASFANPTAASALIAKTPRTRYNAVWTMITSLMNLQNLFNESIKYKGHFSRNLISCF